MDFNAPSISGNYATGYTDVIVAHQKDLAKFLDSGSVSVSAPVTGIKRYNTTNDLFENYNGSTWEEMPLAYLKLTGGTLTAGVTFDAGGWSNGGSLTTLANAGATSVWLGHDPRNSGQGVVLGSGGVDMRAGSYYMAVAANGTAALISPKFVIGPYGTDDGLVCTISGDAGTAGLSIFENSSGNTARLRIFQNATQAVYNATWNTGSNGHKFQIGNSDRFTIDSSGFTFAAVPFTVNGAADFNSTVNLNGYANAYNRIRSIRDTQTDYSNACIEAYAGTGNVHISWHAGGNSACSLKHVRNGSGLVLVGTDGSTAANFQCAGLTATSVTATSGYFSAAVSQAAGYSIASGGNLHTGTGGSYYVYSYGSIYAEGNITAYYVSDERLKEDITPLTDAMAAVRSLSGFRYRFNELGKKVMKGNYTDKWQVGVSAQQVQRVLPEVTPLAPVDMDQQTGESISGENYLTVQYEKITPLLIEALKEVDRRLQRVEGVVA